MNFKQLTYTSVGLQGWSIERMVGDPGEKERNIFKRINGRRPVNSVLYTYDFKDGVGVLSRSVPYGTDTEYRGRYYSHGYVFSGNLCDEVFENYSILLGIDYFASGMEDSLPEDVKSVKFKYKLPEESLCIVVEGIYEALMRDENMEVLCPGEDGEILIKTIMNTVYKYIPLKLRKYISFGSDVGENIRDIAVAENFSNYTKIRYNLKNGETAGIDGRFNELVDVLLSENGGECIKLIEEKIGDRGNDKMSYINAFKSVIADVLFEMSAYKRIYADDIPERLNEVLNRKKYDNPADIKVMCSIFAGIKRNSIKLPEGFDEKIADVYLCCNNSELQNAIVNYYSSRILESENILRDINEMIKGSWDDKLKTDVSVKLISTKEPDIVRYIAMQTINNDDYGRMLLKSCSERVIDIISESITAFISENKDSKELFLHLFDSDLFMPVMTKITDVEGVDLWPYFNIVYSSSKFYQKHRMLNKKTISFFKTKFEAEASEHHDQIYELLYNAYLQDEKEFYGLVEEEFIAIGAKNIIEEFYIVFIAPKATSTKELEKYKNKISNLGFSTEKLISSTAKLYAELCFSEAASKTGVGSREIEKINLYIGSCSIEDIDSDEVLNIKELKENFWKKFRFSSYSFTDEVKTMSLSGNNKSQLANALFDFYQFLCGNVSDITAQIFEVCKKELCTNGKILSLRTRRKLLHKLKVSVKNPHNVGIEIYLLLNYSNIRKNATINSKEISAKELYDYVINNISDKESMLHVGSICDSIYKFALKKSISISSKKSNSKKGKSKDKNIYEEIVKIMQEHGKTCSKKGFNPGSGIIGFLRKQVAAIVYYFVILISSLIGNIAVINSKYIPAVLGAGLSTIIITAIAESVYSLITILSKRKNAAVVSGIITGTVLIIITSVLMLISVYNIYRLG